MALKTTTGITDITNVNYDEAETSGTFVATRITADDVAAAFYDIIGSNIYSGSVKLIDGTTTETVRIIEVDYVNNYVYVEQLTNSYDTSSATMTYLGYDGTPGIAELVYNSTTLEVYPSRISADQGINQDRYDLKTIYDLLNTSSICLSNTSQGIIITRDFDNAGVVALKPFGRRVMIADDNNIYLESSTKLLNVANIGNNQFVDIYVEEDDAAAALLTGTKRIALHGEASGSLPYQSSASGKILVASAYVKDNQVSAVHNLENRQDTLIIPFYWTKPWSFNSVAGYEHNTDQIMYIPCFEDSLVTFSFSLNFYTDDGDVNSYAFKTCLRKMPGGSDLGAVNYRQATMTPRTAKHITTVGLRGFAECDQGIHNFRLGGWIDAEVNYPKSRITCGDVSGAFYVTPKGLTCGV